MMLLVGIALTGFVKDVGLTSEFIPLIVTVAVSLVSSLALGCASGPATHYLLKWLLARRQNRIV